MAHPTAYTPLAECEFSTSEIAAMAAVLMRRHGAQAHQVAQDFMREHEDLGDRVRASAWRRVSAHLRDRQGARTLS